jgi:hypothetical protein
MQGIAHGFGKKAMEVFLSAPDTRDRVSRTSLGKNLLTTGDYSLINLSPAAAPIGQEIRENQKNSGGVTIRFADVGFDFAGWDG